MSVKARWLAGAVRNASELKMSDRLWRERSLQSLISAIVLFVL